MSFKSRAGKRAYVARVVRRNRAILAVRKPAPDCADLFGGVR